MTRQHGNSKTLCPAAVYMFIFPKGLDIQKIYIYNILTSVCWAFKMATSLINMDVAAKLIYSLLF